MAQEITKGWPKGFVATRETEKAEWRIDVVAYSWKGFTNEHPVYRFCKFWLDEFTSAPREAKNLGVCQPGNPKDAQHFLDVEMKKWREGGWEIEIL